MRAGYFSFYKFLTEAKSMRRIISAANRITLSEKGRVHISPRRASDPERRSVGLTARGARRMTRGLL